MCTKMYLFISHPCTYSEFTTNNIIKTVHSHSIKELLETRESYQGKNTHRFLKEEI